MSKQTKLRPAFTAVTGEENAVIASDRARVIAILESSEGLRNPELARKLALHSSLDVDSAKNILASAPSANPYLSAMQLEGPTGIEASGVPVSGDAKAERLAEIGVVMDAFNRERGKVKPVGK